MAEGDVRTYYGRPVVKQPAWTWEVPWYLFAGGLGGASSGLAFAARLRGNHRLAAAARGAAGAAALASPVLLVKDLGRPSRFYNMLRVFKPTSAMSMGSWLLGAYSTSTAAGVALRLTGRVPRLQTAVDAVSALLGLPMSTYTAVLMADSSIPVWHEARHHLPYVFAGSAAASAGASAVVAVPLADAGPARRLALVGAVGELAASQVMERRLGELAGPYEQGDSGRYAKAAKGCTAAGAALLATLGGRRRWAAAAGGGLLLAGSAFQRWAVFRAGFQSAADPTYTVTSQRERLEARSS